MAAAATRSRQKPTGALRAGVAQHAGRMHDANCTDGRARAAGSRRAYGTKRLAALGSAGKRGRTPLQSLNGKANPAGRACPNKRGAGISRRPIKNLQSEESGCNSPPPTKAADKGLKRQVGCARPCAPL